MATSIVKPQITKIPTIKRGDLIIGKVHGSVILVTFASCDELKGVVVHGGNRGEPVGQYYTTLSDENYKPFTGSVTLTQD